ncbi:MAG: choice-of-anchor J domain-containing protein [Bacteroidales bacterium]|nr:choice-of-anchor J domain-containing protein [Bacteroidales bacterium]
MKKVLFTLALVAMMLPMSAQITTFPWEEDFTDGSDWTFATYDECSNGVSIGSNGYVVFSYIDETCSANQWAISPALTLPATATDFVLNWWIYTMTYQEIDSHYEVRIATSNSTDTNDFTVTLYDEESATRTWVKRTANLGAYAGQTIRIAFHCITDPDGNSTLLDDVRVGIPAAPLVAIAGPEFALAGESVTFNAASDETDVTYTWYIDGVAQNTNTNSLTTSFDEAGTYEVSVTATNNNGTSDPKSITVTVIACTSTVTEFPWNEGFEYGVGCWTTIDNDGDGYNWLSTLTETDFTATSFVNSGSSAALSHSFQNKDSEGNQILQALNPDNWMISPAISLPTGSYELSWYSSCANPEYGEEKYAVYIATGNTVNDFLNNGTKLFEDITSTTWEMQTANISAYSGQTVYVAFRHFDCTDQFVLGIDDVAIAATSGIESAENDANVAIYPNPVRNMLNVEGENVKNVEIIDVNGRVVLNSNRAGQIDMSELSDGVYMVRVMSENGVSTKKIVKK